MNAEKTYLTKLSEKVKKFMGLFTMANKPQVYRPTHRVLSIEQNEDESYVATIQMINTSYIFKKSPEEILSDDAMTDLFSPRDVRTLTYLGYLGVNSPKYKILAKRLSESDSKITFAVKQKGKREPIIKTADEISSDAQILSGLHQRDAHMVGFVRASESISDETKQKEALLKQLTHKPKSKKIS